MLEIRKVFAGYDGKAVLHGVDLDLRPGEITALAGPNGCGKSTLLKSLVGIVPRLSGSVTLDGVALDTLTGRGRAQRIAYLPQERPIPEITARRLVLHGRFPYLSYPRRYGKKDLEIAENAMAQLGISDLVDRFVPTLSGGQRQKVYLAMALAQDTPVVLLDEPTTFLDIAHQLQLLRTARALADAGKTVVLVLHDLALALRHADRLAVLDGGRLVCADTPDAIYASGCLQTVFGVRIERTETGQGPQYFYADAP